MAAVVGLLCLPHPVAASCCTSCAGAGTCGTICADGLVGDPLILNLFNSAVCGSTSGCSAGTASEDACGSGSAAACTGTFGACTIETFYCFHTTSAVCSAMSGEYDGDGTTCASGLNCGATSTPTAAAVATPTPTESAAEDTPTPTASAAADTPTATATGAANTPTPSAAPTTTPGAPTTTPTVAATATSTPQSTSTLGPPTATPTMGVPDTPTPTATLVPQGGDCDDDADCSTTFCVDGVCCDTQCSGPDQVCDRPPDVGVCVTPPQVAPAVSPAGLLVALAVLIAMGGAALWRRAR